MQVKRVDTTKPQITFTYSNILKTLYKRGKLPSVKYDVSGRKLTKKNATLDHIKPKSQGGKSVLSNYMLATNEFNSLRGAKPITDFLTVEGLSRYINQFIGVVVDGFNGNEYVKMILKTIDEVRVEIARMATDTNYKLHNKR